jgi:hypothetical protein
LNENWSANRLGWRREFDATGIASETLALQSAVAEIDEDVDVSYENLDRLLESVRGQYERVR